MLEHLVKEQLGSFPEIKDRDSKEAFLFEAIRQSAMAAFLAIPGNRIATIEHVNRL